MPDHTGASVGGRMTSNHYDIVVVGGGPAGYAAALAAAGYNLNVKSWSKKIASEVRAFTEAASLQKNS